MTDSASPTPTSLEETLALVDRVVHGDRSMASALGAVIEAADAHGSAALHAIAGRYIEQHADGPRLPMDEVRAHLATAVLPRLAAGGVLEVPAHGLASPESTVQVSPTLWTALRAHRAELARQLKATGEFPRVGRTPTPAVSLPVTGDSVLSAEGLIKAYRGRRVVNDVALNVAQGEIVGLLGPNGAGKTTTFYMLVGLIEPQSGRITLDGQDITGMPMYQRARQGIGYLSQEPSIFRKLTVEQNILAILETLPLSAAERKERLETLLDELSIKHLRSSRAFQLSGGERRRLEITRALVTQPKFMMLDEPFAGVDPIAVHDIQTIVAGLRLRGIGVLISDHNVEQTLDIVDRAYIMFDGQVKVSGTVRELVFDDTVAEKYLGPTLTARLRARFAEADEEVVTS
nr:LPS export ABC transporter ATP-binding protein [Gemmatimonas sp.]